MACRTGNVAISALLAVRPVNNDVNFDVTPRRRCLQIFVNVFYNDVSKFEKELPIILFFGTGPFPPFHTTTLP